MILTAHQPVYLPWLGLFHKIALADTFVSFNQVQYLPKDWNNRNQIKTPRGAEWLTVPVMRKGYLEKPLTEIEIAYDTPWRRKHWRTLHANYCRAPHFARYADFFEDVYKREFKHLAELNDYMLRWFLATLGIKVEFDAASKHNFKGQKSDLVLDMCRTIGATTYIFGAMGADYADSTAFAQAGIHATFQSYQHPRYAQAYGEFLPNLSIVDLLFNCGDSSLDILMSGNLQKSELLAAPAEAALHPVACAQ